MRIEWSRISKEHVVEAIHRYELDPDSCTQARNTFLSYNGKIYPAKAIRGIAYEVCFGVKIGQESFTGGTDTERFFRNLGFAVKRLKSKNGAERSSSQLHKPAHRKPGQALDKVSQKNALQALLQKNFGIVIAEKGFDWLCVPRDVESDDLYHSIYKALCDYRGHKNFIQPGRRLTVDFYIDSLNLVIEYDENQHFSNARRIAIECYPPKSHVGFSTANWIEMCEQIRAADNDPKSRDETRAFYDSVRDIEILRHGTNFLRIYHGFVNWEDPGSEAILMDMLRPYIEPKDRLDATVADPKTNIEWRDWRCFEIDVQRIRLNYLKWFYHFTPPDIDFIPSCGSGDDLHLFESQNGSTFTAFPCGLGSVYVGGGRGMAKLPKQCFSSCPDLDKETLYLKESLFRRTQEVKQQTILTLDKANLEHVWNLLLEYWWIKLGFHEFAHDVAYEFGAKSSSRTYGVRDALVNAMRNGLTAKEIDQNRFSKENLQHFIRYQMNWNRYACCSFECGPIVVGKSAYVPYEKSATVCRSFFAGRDIAVATETEKRLMAKASLSDLFEFLVVYYEEPLSKMKHYCGFQKNRTGLIEVIDNAQEALNKIIMDEHLNLPLFTYLPVA